MAKLDVICLGEAMIELSLPGPPPGPANVGFAGDTFNTAIYLKRCAPELNVAFATCMGRDRFSDAFLALMEEERLDTSLVARSDTRLPGMYAISTDEAGERSFNYWRDQAAARTMLGDGGLTAQALDARYLFFSAISMAILPQGDRAKLLGWLPDFRASGRETVFDSNFRPALWPDRREAQTTIGACWSATDIGLPSVDDEAAIFDDADEAAALARLRAHGLRNGALKRGAAGPLALDGSAAGPFAPVGEVVDSTAAGDSFNAGFIAALAKGETDLDAARAGHNLAAKVIQHPGAIIPADA